MRYQLFDTKPAQASFLKHAKQYWADESGATAIEYGLISALIGVLCISGATFLGGSLKAKFQAVAFLLSGPAEGAITNSF